MSNLEFFEQQIKRVISHMAEHETRTWLQSFNVQLEMRFVLRSAEHGTLLVRIEFLYFPFPNGKVSFVPRYVTAIHEVDGDSANERRDRSADVEARLHASGALYDGDGAEVADSWYRTIHDRLGSHVIATESLRWSYFYRGDEHAIPVS